MAEREVNFETAFRESGGARQRASVPYPITYEYVREACQKREHLLRIQFEDEKFEPEAERILETLSIDDPTQAWRRWDYIKGLWFVWERGFKKRDEGQDRASWMLLAREPVRIRIGSRIVAITSRGRAAMIRLARHEATRRSLGARLDAIELRIVDARGWRARRVLSALADRVEREWEYQTRGILANALSETGRAALPEEAPEWWSEITAEDEARILFALIEAGPERFREVMKSKPAAPKKAAEELDFGTLLRMWEAKYRVPPMTFEDADLAQYLHALDIGSPGSHESDIEDAFAA